MKSKHIKTTLALFSTLALVSITVTTVDAKTIGNAESTQVGKTTAPAERTVTRTITVINPLSKEKTVIKQVATINIERINAKHPDMWPEFVAPEFKGYRPSELQLNPVKMTPKTKSVDVTIDYQPFTDKVAPATRYFVLDDVDNPYKSSFTIPVHSDQFGRYKLPTPPAGYHYFIKNLPKEIQYFPNTGHSTFYLTIKKDGNNQGKIVSKVLTRKVIFHLPAGDKVIEQSARADFKNGHWIIQSFPKLTVPQVDGYVSTVKSVPDLQVEENAIDQVVPTFEAQYSKNTSDQKDSSKEKGEETAQGSKVDSKDSSTATSQTGQEKGSQTTDTVKSDGSTQTEDSGISSSTQTDTDKGQDADTQTSETEKADASTQAGESTSSATQTETTDSKDAGTQTAKQQVVSESTQTSETEKVDASTQAGESTSSATQTETTDSKDAGTQTAKQEVASESTQTSEGVSAGTQTDGGETKEEGSQTTVMGMEDSTSQTENPEESSTATQTEPNIQISSSATQTDDEVQGVSVATQTDGVSTNSTGTKTPPSVSVGTQTEAHSSTTSVATQTEDNGVSEGMQTESIIEESTGTQTEVPKLDSSTTQTTNNLGNVSTGTQTSGTIDKVSSGTQTAESNPSEGVQTDLNGGNDAETQTGDVNGSSSAAQHVSTGSQTEADPSSVVSSSTQTDENTITTSTQTDNSGLTSTATQTSGSQTSDGTQTDPEEGSDTITQPHQPVYVDNSSQAQQTGKVNSSQVAGKGDPEGNNSPQLNGNTQAGEGPVSDVPETYTNQSFFDNSADPTSMRPQSRSGLDHHLQQELNRIQDPLRSLENEPITANGQLPQTGNEQSSTKTTALGLVTIAWAAAVSLFALKRKFK